MSPFHTSDSDRITLVTADDPAVRHSIPRSRLCNLSRTFDNLLSLPTGSSGDASNEMELTETDAELEGFLKVIKGEEIVDGDFLVGGTTDWSGETDRKAKIYWINLARMADKYDCPTARLSVTSLFWLVLLFEK